MINKIHDVILNNPKVKVREIDENASISTKRVVNILHTHLCKMGAAITRIDQNSGLNLVEVHKSIRKRNNRLGKLWLVFFWDAHGVIFVHYF